jgi:hypothetical protein
MPDVWTKLEGGYRIAPFAAQDEVDAAAVMAMWEREGALDAEERRRRVHEVLLVATTAEGELVGIATVYLGHVEQFGLDLWHFRTFVARSARLSSLALTLTNTTRELLSERFVSRQDLRGKGLFFELENKGLQQRFPHADWLWTAMIFVGVNARGDHLRVHWFPGAEAPAPQG